MQTVYDKARAIFASAVEDRVISRSPCTRRVRLPHPHGGEVVPMRPEQVRAMVDNVSPRFRALVILLAGAGLRPGEGARPDRRTGRLLRRTINIDRQLVTVTGSEPFLAPPKTPSSVRTIPVPQAVVDALAAHLAEFPAGPSGLVFTDSKGDPVRRNEIGHVWRRAAARAGVDGFSWHDLRHYAASTLIDKGASVKAVQRHLGHSQRAPRSTSTRTSGPNRKT